MVTYKAEMVESINLRLLLYCIGNKGLAKFNYTDGAVAAEDLFAELFNILYRSRKANFFNANKKSSTYPGVDLIDLDNKMAAQVTIECKLSKVKNSFKTIPKIKDHKLYTKIWFVIQSNNITKGMKDFGPKHQGYEVSVICITDILRDINGLQKADHVEEICDFIQKSIKIPDVAVAKRHVDGQAFEILFNALKRQITKEDLDEIEDPIIIYKSSPQEKKEKFKSSWKQLINLYKTTLGMTGADNDHVALIDYEKHISECFSQDLNEVQKNLILKYLRVESFIILEKNLGKPLEAINELTEKMKVDFDVSFLSKTQVMSFIMNMFFMCDVFPLDLKSNEEE